MVVYGLRTTVPDESCSEGAHAPQAEDDPIAVEPAIPYKSLADNPNCILVTTPGGGHLGWAAGGGGPFGEFCPSDEHDFINQSQNGAVIPVLGRQWHPALRHTSCTVVQIWACVREWHQMWIILCRWALDGWRDHRVAQQRAAGAVRAGQAARQVCPAGHAGHTGRPARRQQARRGVQWGREEGDSRAVILAKHSIVTCASASC